MTLSHSKVALVLGGSGGIGAAIAKQLAGKGIKVIIQYYKNIELANNVIESINRSSLNLAVGIHADLGNENECEGLVKEIIEEYGAIDYVIQSASPSNNPLGFKDLAWQDVKEQIDINVRSVFLILEKILPQMEARGEGSIVFLGSCYTSATPPTNQLRYIVAKSALTSMAKCLAVEYGPKNIRINTVSPGMTETNMITNLPEKVKLTTKMQTPLRKLGNASDVAKLVEFLLSSEASHITGQNFRVDGGMVMD